jgi:HEAT repeat protein
MPETGTKHRSISRRRFLKTGLQGTAAAATLSLLPGLTACSSWRSRVVHRRSLNLLFNGLTVNDPVVQAESARLLGELALPQAVRPLVTYVKTSPYYSKTAGFNALAAINRPEVCDRIVPLIQDPKVTDDPGWYNTVIVRSAAALAVLRLDPGREPGYFDRQYDMPDNWQFNIFCLFYSPLIVRAADTDPKISRLKKYTLDLLYSRRWWQPERLTVISRALGIAGGPQAAAELKWFLQFPSRYVRGQAALDLLKTAPTPENVELVAGLHKQDLTGYVKLKSAGALVRAGQKQYAGHVRQAITNEKDPLLRATALELAGTGRDPEDRPLIIEQLKHDKFYIRLCAIEALGNYQDGSCGAAVSPLVDDSNIRVRLQAAKFILTNTPKEKV